MNLQEKIFVAQFVPAFVTLKVVETVDKHKKPIAIAAATTAVVASYAATAYRFSDTYGKRQRNKLATI